MNHKTQRLRFLVASFLITFAHLCLAEIVRAETRPFKGRIEGTFINTPTENPAVFFGGASATGLATHVGSFTKVTSDLLNIVTGAVDGSFTISSADGEFLTGVYSGFVTPGEIPGTFSWVLHARYTGGTGRFVNATGNFVFIAEGQYVIADGNLHGAYTETFEGVIDY
jgi:hypothetical protein